MFLSQFYAQVQKIKNIQRDGYRILSREEEEETAHLDCGRDEDTVNPKTCLVSLE